MLLLNLKTYSESNGDNLYKMLDTVSTFINDYPQFSKDSNKLFIAPPLIYLSEVINKYPNINFVSQNVSSKLVGQSTGAIVVENLLSLGVKYSLYNHSECKINNAEMYSLNNGSARIESVNELIVQEINNIHNRGLKLMVFTEDINEAKELIKTNPEYLIYEPRDLIGSGISVTTRPESVTQFINTFKNTNTKLLIGAGVTTQEDVVNSLTLGASGVALASSFVKAPNHYEKLVELTKPLIDINN